MIIQLVVTVIKILRIEGFWWGNLKEKRPLGRPSRRWEDNIKMDLQEVGMWGYGLDPAG